MSFDYSKLQGKIVEVVSTRSEFANRLGINEATLSLKLNNSGMFKQNEIYLACEILGIPNKKIPEYFFTAKTHNCE